MGKRNATKLKRAIWGNSPAARKRSSGCARPCINRRVKQRQDSLEIVELERPPDKPNLRFEPETIRQGKQTLLMQPQPLAEVHPFEPTLRKWQQGIPVDCGSDWARSVIDAAVERGPHPTACTPESIALFAEDIEYQIKAGFC